MIVFDENLRNLMRQRAAPNGTDHDFLIRMAWADIIDRLDMIKRTFNSAYTLSTRALDTLKSSQKILSNIRPLSYHHGELIAPDGPRPDLILSCFDLHSINDLPGLLAQIRNLLEPDGVFIAAFPGGETLYQLRSAITTTELALRGGISPRIFPFIDKQQAGALMQRAGFSLPVVDSETTTIDYTNLTRLCHDLRYMGEGNAIAARDKRIPPKHFFTETEKVYQAQSGTKNGYIPATFEIIHVIGWGPSDKQQKPLKPGSAQLRLADALGTKEIGADDFIHPDPKIK